jgi:hypothetical protein
VTSLHLPPLDLGRTVPLGAPPVPEPERTKTVEELLSPIERSSTLVNRSWILRNDSLDLHQEIVDNHADIIARDLDVQAHARAADGIGALLGQLADAGLAWVDIAALAVVSVPAVRKWRQGGSASGEKLFEVARAVVLLEWLHTEQSIADVASWLEIPLDPAAPIARIDLLKAGRRDLVIRSLVGDETNPTELLDEFDADWRTRFESDFEVFTAADGQRSIRTKGHAS